MKHNMFRSKVYYTDYQFAMWLLRLLSVTYLSYLMTRRVRVMKRRIFIEVIGRKIKQVEHAAYFD